MSVDPAIVASQPGPLQDLTARIVGDLAELATAENHEAGEVLLRVNSAADRFHIVTDGRFRVGLAIHGRPSLTLQTLRPGDLAGLSWMWPPRRWQWDVIAQEASSTVSFDAAAVLAHCQEDVEFRAAIVDLVAAELHERLSHSRLQLLDMYGVPPR